jgi:hypothetical protein
MFGRREMNGAQRAAPIQIQSDRSMMPCILFCFFFQRNQETSILFFFLFFLLDSSSFNLNTFLRTHAFGTVNKWLHLQYRKGHCGLTSSQALLPFRAEFRCALCLLWVWGASFSTLKGERKQLGMQYVGLFSALDLFIPASMSSER